MDQPLNHTRSSAESLHLLSDEEFLAQLAWERTSSVPATLRKAARDGKVAQVAKLLQSRLNKRFHPPRQRAGVVHRERTSSAALWSQSTFEMTERSAALVQVVKLLPAPKHPARSNRGRNANKKPNVRAKANGPVLRSDRLLRWLDYLDVRNPLSPFEQLMLAEVLRETGPQLPPHEFFRIWRLLLTAFLAEGEQSATESDSGLTTETPSSTENLPAEHSPDQQTPDSQLIVDGELPWQMGLLFAELSMARRWREEGKRTLRRALLDQTDHNGFPRADLLERLAFWMAPLVRAREWAVAGGQQLWTAEAENRFGKLIRSAASLCRTDGRFALSNGFVASAAELLTSASTLAGTAKDAPSTKLLRELEILSRKQPVGLRQVKRGRKRRSKKTLTKFPGAQSDWAQFACLRSDWSIDADALVVAHHEPIPQLELTAFGVPLLSGPWEIALSLDGTPLELTHEWSCVCWYSDADADYLELKTEHPSGVRIERQILLAREDHLALFAETVAGPSGARIDCTSRLPLVHGAEIQSDTPTRECRLKAPRVSARAFAPVLPCERVQGTSGYFGSAQNGSDGERLELRQQAAGGLYAPIVIDWHPGRRRSYADWRKLTVTEDGRVLSSDIANGCRLRIGEDQWVFYRSMRQSVMGRAVLGHHTHNETVIGRFDSDGNIDPILLVEYPEESTQTT